MFAALHAARVAAEGHEAVCVSHQLPIWTLRRYVERKRLWHDPRRRQCGLASLTSLPLRRREGGRHRLLRAGRPPGRDVAGRADGQGRLMRAPRRSPSLRRCRRRASRWPACGAASRATTCATNAAGVIECAGRPARAAAPPVTGELLDGGALRPGRRPGQGRRGQLLGLAGARPAGPRPTTWRTTYQATKATGVDVPRRQHPRRPGQGEGVRSAGRVDLPEHLRPGRQGWRSSFDVPPNTIPATIILDRAGPDRGGDPRRRCSRGRAAAASSTRSRRPKAGLMGETFAEHRQRRAAAAGDRRGRARRAGQLPVAVRAAAGAGLSVLCDRPGRRRPRRRAGDRPTAAARGRVLAGVGAVHRRLHRRCSR